MNKQLKNKNDDEAYAIVATTSFRGLIHITIDSYSISQDTINLAKWSFMEPLGDQEYIFRIKEINLILAENGFEEISENTDLAEFYSYNDKKVRNSLLSKLDTE